MQDKAVRFPKLKKIVGASRSTIFRWERDGKFPGILNSEKTVWRGY